ncbi:MAG: cyclophilin-like fold protein [Nanoarchaeota archaeon]
MKIKIFFGHHEIEAVLDKTPTAKAIYEALPFDGAASRWGDEIYFPIPVSLKAEKSATENVKEGDVAYWPEGHCFCVFFGKTPASTENQIRAASKVNVVGKIKETSMFHEIKDGDLIIVEQA